MVFTDSPGPRSLGHVLPRTHSWAAYETTHFNGSDQEKERAERNLSLRALQRLLRKRIGAAAWSCASLKKSAKYNINALR